MTRVYVDFNTMMTDGEHVHIRNDSSIQNDPDVARSLHHGSAVVLCDDEMEVEAIVVGEERCVWLAKPDWSTRRDYPDS
jgi:hypothetical protein